MIRKTGKSPYRPGSIISKEKWYNAFKKIISSDIPGILILCGACRLIYYSFFLNTQAGDSPSYLRYHGNIFTGQIDRLRTPAYPCFINLIRLFGDKNLIDNIVIAQCILSFLSIIVFFYVVHAVFKSRPAILTSTLLFGLMLPTISYDKVIMTESLSVCSIIAFIGFIVSYFKKPTLIKAILLTLFVFFAMMLRPAFIYLLPVMILFWVLRFILYKEEKKFCLSGLLTSGFVIILIIGYSELNDRENSFDGISIVSTNINQLNIIINTKMYNNGNDTELSKEIETYLRKPEPGGGHWSLLHKINQNYAPKRISKFVTVCIRNQPGLYIKNIFQTAYSLTRRNIFTNYAKHKPGFFSKIIAIIENRWFNIGFSLIYLYLIFDLIYFIINWTKLKRVLLFRVLLWLLVVAQLAVAIIGAQDEYQRLVVTAIPCLIILLFFHFDKLCYFTNPSFYKKDSSFG
ncbi:MAG: Dolichyl-phosphate-mannose-protein mannosyltransferase [Chitinophagaceae bacterium]|nr:Dolichyl-phosphate-mannose-protein mannosyltransferase [Chitinophagaceae bacterium]